MTIEETPVRRPTYIPENTFLNRPANLLVLNGATPNAPFEIPSDGMSYDYLYWVALLVAGVAGFFIVNNPDLLYYTLIIAGGVVLGIAYLDRILFNREMTQRFQGEGHILRGELLSCTASIDNSLWGNNSAFYVTVKYRFTTPSEQVREATHTEVRHDLNGQPLPLPETPVYLLYFNDREFYLL